MRYNYFFVKTITIFMLAVGLAVAVAPTASAATYSQSEANCKIARPVLLPNDRGTCVLLVQKLLSARGFLHATPNGVYGPQTAQAVNDLQAKAGYIPANQVGPRTWAILLSSTAPTTSNPGNVPTACLRAGKTICIDKTGGSNATLWALQDRKIVYGPVWATTGDARGAAYKTQEGTMTVTFKDAKHKSKEFNNAPMPNSIFFTSNGEAIHSGSVNASHGCVHVSPAASKWLFDFAVAGSTKVTVTP